MKVNIYYLRTKFFIPQYKCRLIFASANESEREGNAYEYHHSNLRPTHQPFPDPDRPDAVLEYPDAGTDKLLNRPH
jgi:hypothetical protein